MTSTIKSRMLDAITEGLEEAELSLSKAELITTARLVASSVFDEFLVSTTEQYIKGSLIPIEGPKDASTEDDWK